MSHETGSPPGRGLGGVFLLALLLLAGPLWVEHVRGEQQALVQRDAAQALAHQRVLHGVAHDLAAAARAAAAPADLAAWGTTLVEAGAGQAGVTALCLRDAQGAVWAASPPAAAPAACRAPVAEHVLVHGLSVGTLHLLAEPVSMSARHQVLPITWAALAVAAAAALTALHGLLWARRAGRRRRALAQVADAIGAGDFTLQQAPVPHQGREPRLARLDAALQAVHEARETLQHRLVVLRGVEPDATRAATLTAWAQALDGSDRFAIGALGVRPAPPVPAAGVWPWVVVALAASVVALAAHAAGGGMP